MKTTSLFLAFIFTIALNAQEIKPIFEKNGDVVTATYFHGNGEISQTGDFVSGKLHGEWKMFDEKGEKLTVGTYTNGKKTGKWFFWKGGKELREVDYMDSKIVNVTNWNNMESFALNK